MLRVSFLQGRREFALLCAVLVSAPLEKGYSCSYQALDLLKLQVC